MSLLTLLLSRSNVAYIHGSKVLLYCHHPPDIMNTTIKSIVAVFVGLIFIGVTHTATDTVLESVGFLPKGHLNVGTELILFVILYRAVFSVAGCYLTARLAPANPMKHALILGGIGVVLSASGAIVTADMNLGPAWYAWSLVVISLPAAWLGAKLFLASRDKKLSNV
jgi:hypothetical protein